jgi:hypothetical protein
LKTVFGTPSFADIQEDSIANGKPGVNAKGEGPGKTLIEINRELARKLKRFVQCVERKANRPFRLVVDHRRLLYA